jgi:hypothetical protein
MRLSANLLMLATGLGPGVRVGLGSAVNKGELTSLVVLLSGR